MQEDYINRLIRCGFSPCSAYLVYHQFLKEHSFSEKELEEFLSDFETDNESAGVIYVDRI